MEKKENSNEGFIRHLKRNWKNYVIGILVVLFLLSGLFDGLVRSSSNMLSEQSYDKVSYNMGGSYPYSSDSFAPETTERKVIKNANINLETDNFDSSKSQIKSSVSTYNVIVLSETENRYKDNYRNVNFRFKVEADELDSFLNEIKNSGEIMGLNVYMNDVTGTYADYTARLDRYKTQITRYESMLTKPNITIKEEIEIQNRIDDLENQIFSLNSRIAGIDEDTQYSDVSVILREKPSFWSEIDFLGFKEGLSLFVNSLETGIQFILAIFGFVLPFAVIYGIYRLVRRFI